ncbi:CoA transferase [Cupriavidus sp. KK10]|jgi:crotonobetainyl-CoA:carnitine CoA-transferase CaiB-like acyl-CoA transferase|uniref:CoA transferase n=1 Tax=Cupriavidus sp. KK10 TaxID=1478019 RepID=UPI0020122821|nr:CoA transferase [Cupriavidus sp. KK10]
MMLNRGKRSIGINMENEVGRAALLRMVAQADVLTENFPLGVMERLGLGYDVLREVNPAPIYCSITGDGRTGETGAALAGVGTHRLPHFDIGRGITMG